MLKAYKYRIYPSKKQQIQIEKTFDCCRFTYNRMLAYRREMYEKEKIFVSRTDCSNYLNRELKAKYGWLKEADKFALTNAVYHMDSAYQNFFRNRAGYPRFKSWYGGRKSYTTNFTNGNIAVNFEEGKVKLPKLKMVRAALHRPFEGQVKNAAISQTSDGKYYVSILVETDHEAIPLKSFQTGVISFKGDSCVLWDGKVYESPKNLEQQEKKLAKLQRQLASKERGSHNYNKQKKKISRCRERINNISRDYCHQISHEVISKDQVIILEKRDSSKSGIQGKRKMGMVWYELERQLEYKAKWNGRLLILADNGSGGNRERMDTDPDIEKNMKIF